MNFSIHLPQPLLVNLDQFAKSHNISRSGVVREAVESYLAQKAGSCWPDDVLAWMRLPPDSGDALGLPDFDAMRIEGNNNWQSRSDAQLENLSS